MASQRLALAISCSCGDAELAVNPCRVSSKRNPSEYVASGPVTCTPGGLPIVVSSPHRDRCRRQQPATGVDYADRLSTTHRP